MSTIKSNTYTLRFLAKSGFKKKFSCSGCLIPMNGFNSIYKSYVLICMTRLTENTNF